MTTLQQALTLATSYWASKGPSSRMMPIRARKCLDILHKAYESKHTGNMPLGALDPIHGTALLTGLQNEGLSKGSIQAYYAAFRRMVNLAGGSTNGWPSSPPPPRRVREPIKLADLAKLEKGLQDLARRRLWWCRHDEGLRCETADLLVLLRGTGMRVEVEALSWENWAWEPGRKVLVVKGKGEHERLVPVEDPETEALLNDPDRLAKMRKLGYDGHLGRWNKVVKALGITSKLPTPHAVRHLYATRAYERSGRNLVTVQLLLGHADVGTTARYIGVSVEDLRSSVPGGAGEDLRSAVQ